MEEVPKFELGAADLRRHLANKFLQVAIVPANAYQRSKFQLSNYISLANLWSKNKGGSS